MSDLDDGKADDLHAVSSALAQAVGQAALAFCDRHGLSDDHDPVLATLIITESVTLRLLLDLFSSDQARHQVLAKMHKAVGADLRKVAQQRGLIHPVSGNA